MEYVLVLVGTLTLTGSKAFAAAGCPFASTACKPANPAMPSTTIAAMTSPTSFFIPLPCRTTGDEHIRPKHASRSKAVPCGSTHPLCFRKPLRRRPVGGDRFLWDACRGSAVGAERRGKPGAPAGLGGVLRRRPYHRVVVWVEAEVAAGADLD